MSPHIIILNISQLNIYTNSKRPLKGKIYNISTFYKNLIKP